VNAHCNGREPSTEGYDIWGWHQNAGNVPQAMASIHVRAAPGIMCGSMARSRLRNLTNWAAAKESSTSSRSGLHVRQHAVQYCPACNNTSSSASATLTERSPRYIHRTVCRMDLDTVPALWILGRPVILAQPIDTLPSQCGGRLGSGDLARQQNRLYGPSESIILLASEALGTRRTWAASRSLRSKSLGMSYLGARQNP
jgi:hypothetical protein